LFCCILLLDIPEDLSYIIFELLITSKYLLCRSPGQHVDLSIIVLISHEVVDVGLDPIKSYTSKVTDSMDYFGCLRSKQVLVEKDIDIH